MSAPSRITSLSSIGSCADTFFHPRPSPQSRLKWPLPAPQVPTDLTPRAWSGWFAIPIQPASPTHLDLLPEPQIVAFPDSVGCYPDPVGCYPGSVGRYPGPRRPGTRSVAVPILSAATPVHAPPELGRLLSDRVGRYPFPPCRLVIVSTPTAGSRVAAIRCCCCCCCLPLSLLIGRRLAQQYQTR